MRRELRAAAVRLPDVLAPGTRLVVGFSGGQDSTCLLHGLCHLRGSLELTAVHVDHALRADSSETARQVVDLARAIGVACDVTRIDVAAYRQTLTRASTQQAARAARYQALAVAARQHQAAAVLVAHTADDQAETLLLNLLRGSGLMGLAGMRMDESVALDKLGPPALEGLAPGATLRLVRPLLRVPRVTTLAYCSHFGLGVIEDASNRSRAYTRNRVRLDVLPLLEQFNPAIRTVLARTAELAGDDLAAMDEVVTHLFARLAHDHQFDLAEFRAQPRALQRRLLRMGLVALTGQLTDVPDAPIEDALDLVQTGRAQQTYHLPYGVELCLSRDSFTLRRGGRARARQPRKN
ncbi:MAG TPA: tRNA lysidine(34) synthetase TilS [Chloroflexota bacterium]